METVRSKMIIGGCAVSVQSDEDVNACVAFVPSKTRKKMFQPQKVAEKRAGFWPHSRNFVIISELIFSAEILSGYLAFCILELYPILRLNGGLFYYFLELEIKALATQRDIHGLLCKCRTPHDDFNSIGHRGLHGNLPMNTGFARAS